MDFGWIISGPGTTWVDGNFQLCRNRNHACVFHDPATALDTLRTRYDKETKWKLHKLSSELVAYSGLAAWLPY